MRFYLILFTSLLFFSFTKTAQSQLEASNWHFGLTIKGLYFSPAGVVSVTSGSYTPYGAEGCSVLSDPVTGNLKFYTDGTVAVDAGNTVMPNGSGLLSLSSSEGSGKIAADPGNCNRFYIFHNTSAFENASATRNLYYSIVDMTLPGNGTMASPKGDVVAGSKNIIVAANVAEGMEIIPETNTHNFWLLTTSYSGSSVSVYKFTASGISFLSSYALITTMSDMRPIRFCKANNKLAIGSMNDFDNVLIMNFNCTTGVISGQSVVPGLPPGTHGNYYGTYGLEWSQDGTKLYISKYRENVSGGKLYQYDLTTSLTQLIYNVNSVSVSFSGRGLKMGPDGKIYYLYMNTAGMVIDIGAVNNPNNPGASCGFNPTQINMGSDLLNTNKFPDFLYSNDSIRSIADTSIFIAKSCSVTSDTFSININKPLIDLDGDLLSYQVINTTFPGGSANFTSPGIIQYINPSSSNFIDTLTIKYCDNYCISKCKAFKIILHITLPNTSIPSMPSSLTSCAGASLLIDAGPGLINYNWSTGATTQTINVSGTGLYYVTANDASGCIYSDSTNVIFSPFPTALITGEIYGCSPLTANFLNQSTNAVSYIWNFGNGSSSLLTNPSTVYTNPGTYDVTLIVTNSAGCSDTISIPAFVTVVASPVASILSSTSFNSVTDNTSTTIYNQSAGGTDCVLYFGDGDSLSGCSWTDVIHNYQNPGTYTITQIVTNADGCSDTAQISVVVEFETTLYVPNAFTPGGGNGLNDIFKAYGVGLTDFKLMIFNRWGEMIFQSTDINKGWDGSYKGQGVEQDVYVWKITYSTKELVNQVRIGQVTVVR